MAFDRRPLRRRPSGEELLAELKDLIPAKMLGVLKTALRFGAHAGWRSGDFIATSAV